jgi:tryptophan-rich sensory protein
MKDAAGVILQTSVGLAGLLLVFIGFVYSRGESFSSSVRADKFKNVARAGFFPFGLALLCGWVALNAMSGDSASYAWALITFRTTVVVLGLYAFVVVFVYL